MSENKMERLKELIELKKKGNNTPVPRKGRGSSIEDSSTTMGTKKIKKVKKSGGHNSK